MLHSKGHGYDKPTMPGSEPCSAFNGLRVVANPLGGFSNADRERRAFYPPNGGTGVTYDSHSLQLGVSEDTPKADRLFLMMSHGGGREVYSMRNGVYYVPILDSILALPEREQYSLLYSIWESQQHTRHQAIQETDAKWRRALEEGRVKKRRPKRGVHAGGYDILSDWELPQNHRARQRIEDIRVGGKIANPDEG